MSKQEQGELSEEDMFNQIVNDRENPAEEPDEELEDELDELDKELDEDGREEGKEAGDEESPAKPEPSIEEKLKKLEAENELLRQKDRSQRGRLSERDKEINRLRRQLSADVPTAAPLAENDPEWQAFAADFPGVAASLIRNQNAMQAALATTRNQIKATGEVLVNTQAADYRSAQMGALYELHPDLDEVTASQEFQTWRETAPDGIKQILEHSNDANVVGLAIDAFKSRFMNPTETEESEVEKIKRKRNSQMRQAAGIPTRNTGRAIPQGEDDLDEEAIFNRVVRERERKRMRY